MLDETFLFPATQAIANNLPNPLAELEFKPEAVVQLSQEAPEEIVMANAPAPAEGLAEQLFFYSAEQHDRE